MWSERLAPAYFSKGPGVAFAIRASTAIFGDYGIRRPVLESRSSARRTSLLVYYFTRRLFSETAGFWAVLALNAIPLFNVGNLVMTIDPLSIFFWTAAMFTFWLALERNSAFLLVLARDRSAHRPRISLQIHERARARFRGAGARARSAACAGNSSGRGFICCSALSRFAWCRPSSGMRNTPGSRSSHLRSRGSLDQALGFHPLEVLGFLGAHFLTFSPLLFLALAWAVVANWRRARQQFKVLYLVWFGLPVFLFYLLISFNNQAAPNWDVLAFISLAVLAAAFWHERLERSGAARRFLYVGLLLGLGLSLFALEYRSLAHAEFPFPHHRDPADRVRGWKSATRAVEKVRAEFEPKIGEKVFLIADQRDRASEMAFYFHHKRTEGPGHPPVYIVESQDIENQFSFWPRYDEFVEAPPNTPLPDGEVYTEEGGINQFNGRSALYVQSGKAPLVPHNIRAAFQSADRIATIEVRRFGVVMREWNIFACRNYRTLPL